MAKSSAERNDEWDGLKRTCLQHATRKLGSPLTLDRRASSRWGHGLRGAFAILGAPWGRFDLREHYSHLLGSGSANVVLLRWI